MVFGPENKTKNKLLKPDYDKAVEVNNTGINDPTGSKRQAKKKTKASYLYNKPSEREQ